MIDVSDGLALDLHRLADASGVGFELDAVPVAAGATVDEALGGGEDYELLMAVTEGSRRARRRVRAKGLPSAGPGRHRGRRCRCGSSATAAPAPGLAAPAGVAAAFGRSTRGIVEWFDLRFGKGASLAGRGAVQRGGDDEGVRRGRVGGLVRPSVEAWPFAV